MIVNLYSCATCGADGTQLSLECYVSQDLNGEFSVQVMQDGHYCTACDLPCEITCAPFDLNTKTLGEFVWWSLLAQMCIDYRCQHWLGEGVTEFIQDVSTYGWKGYDEQSFDDVYREAECWFEGFDATDRKHFEGVDTEVALQEFFYDHLEEENGELNEARAYEDEQAKLEDKLDGEREERRLERG